MVSRRDALQGIGATLASLAAAACSKKEVAFVCIDTTGITPDDAQVRTALAYADESNEDGKSCANCQQFVAGPTDGCGTCKIMKGPIHPKGYCKVYARKG